MGENPDIRPDKDWLCTMEQCPSYDGKRCMVMGFRPDRFCEPKIKLVKEELRRCRRAAVAIDMMEKYGGFFEQVIRKPGNKWVAIWKTGATKEIYGMDLAILAGVRAFLLNVLDYEPRSQEMKDDWEDRARDFKLVEEMLRGCDV